MKVRVKYDELYKLGEYIAKKDEDMKKLQSEIEQIKDNIPNYWVGVDSDLFNVNFTDFINTTKNDEINHILLCLFDLINANIFFFSLAAELFSIN